MHDSATLLGINELVAKPTAHVLSCGPSENARSAPPGDSVAGDGAPVLPSAPPRRHRADGPECSKAGRPLGRCGRGDVPHMQAIKARSL